MEQFRNYLLGLLCTALLCGVVNQVVGSKSFAASAIRLISGFCMVLAVASPLVNFRMPNLSGFMDQLEWQSNRITAEGESYTKQAMEEIITERTQAYILEKAESCGAVLTVELTLSGDPLPVPVAVKLSGSISPYHRQVMTEMLEEELGIATEAQIWIINA